MKKTTLESGVRVLTERIPGTRSISLGVWIDAGSRDEVPGEHGLCHFLEHMLFKGVPGMSAREIAESFDRMGADVNASTGREQTSIYSRMLEEHFPEALRMTLDMAWRSLIEQKDLEFEKQVVLEEINMHLDSPDEMVHEYLAGLLWEGNPMGHGVLGDSGTIKSVNSEDLRKFYKSRYVTKRAVVVATGAIDHELACELVAKGSGGVNKGRSSPRRNAMPEPRQGRIIHRKDTEQAHITLGAKGLPRGHEDRFALSVLDNILGGTMSSRLFQRVREQMGLAYSIYSFCGLFMGMGMVGVYCGTHPGQAGRVIEVIEEELARARDEGFSGEELQRSKNHIKGSLVIGNEDSGSRMNRIAKAELGGGTHLTIDEMLARIDAVSVDDLHRVYGETWGSAGAGLAVVGPFDEDGLSLSGRI